MNLKWCFILGCTNTAKNSPGKVFVSVPQNLSRKKKWFLAAKRQLEDVSTKTTFYCCEDHFNIKEDMENYLEYRLSKVRARMKPDVVPHIFNCESDKEINNPRLNSENRTRKRTISEISKAYELPKQEEEIFEDTHQPSDMALTTSGKKWRESDTIKFVELYENAECLWNYRHPAYKNRNARDKAIQQIIDKMTLPDFGVNELKNKIKNIRSTYQQEVNKIKRSKAGFAGGCGYVLEEYKTNLAWFPIADRFLSTCINSSKNIATKSEVEDTDDSSLFQNNQSGLFSLVETEMTGELDQQIDEKFSPSYVTTDLHIKEEPIKEEYHNLVPQYNNKKRRLSQPHFLDASGDVRTDEFDFQPPPIMDNTHGDEWFHFGNNVACQLRNMPLERALVSQKRIMEILTEERIEALNREKNEQKKNDSGD